VCVYNEDYIVPTDKATFSARDPSPFTKGGEATVKKKYMDVEQRRSNRRVVEDRRVEIRFELSKEYRRSNSGRRENDPHQKLW